MKSIVYNGPLFLMAISTGTAAWLFIEKWIIDQEFFSNEIVYWIGLISGAPGVAAGVWLWDELRKINLPFTTYLSVLVFTMLCQIGLFASHRT